MHNGTVRQAPHACCARSSKHVRRAKTSSRKATQETSPICARRFIDSSHPRCRLWAVTSDEIAFIANANTESNTTGPQRGPPSDKTISS